MVVIGLAGSLAGAPAVAADRSNEPPVQVQWGACPADVAADAPELQCATVPVPLDYGKPEGTQIEIMVSRRASENPSKRRGVLLLNPGGPGGSGLSQPADLVALGAPASVLDSYDLIGTDTRGIGHSSPVSCGFTADQDYYGNIPPYAADDAAVAEQARRAKAVADQCAANDRDGRMRHLSTANMARDMDRIRAALGEEKVNYFGLSYGTALGAAYASMFPERSDRIVLDSNIGDTFLDRDGMRRFGPGAEQTFPDFAKWAAARHDAYGLGRSPEEVRSTYFALAERLDATPVAGVDGPVFRLATFVGLYREASYAQLAQLWQSVRDSDEEAVRRQLAENGPVGARSGPGTPAPAAEPAEADNAWSVFLAVTCNDVGWSEDVETYRRAVAEDRGKYPLYGAASANILPCAYWRHEPAEPPVRIGDDGPSNVLILQNLRDPVTPHRGGEMLREKFGQRSRLVSVDGSGHGVYVYGDNPCALNVTTDYLVDGELPDRDTFCGASPNSGLALDRDDQQRRAELLDRLQHTP
ncbi:alpha/beta hydrolase [Saccharopolyspora erythraea]|uniref:Secreted hydrolase n=2 Tax=Saccharopolyspora erythraea TaxID=1836 RepID=A4FDE6_SACEN|nr:alpha/beta fold hydrolase [Saccharopolyspora erythraea]CAM02071.1 secreted hydrolase [Saccharopolyspora erythraea NRRL 2338]